MWEFVLSVRVWQMHFSHMLYQIINAKRGNTSAKNDAIRKRNQDDGHAV